MGEAGKWKAVLRFVAMRMEEAGIHYTVVGGASLALQGADLAVKDVDLEMSAEEARHFQHLYAEYAILPVELRESEAYRSIFGQFEIQGVRFEVMGDLQRREGEDWIATAAITHRVVDLEGVPVTVSWIEEEALAYIRRRRLDRAALCLPLCDPDLLLRLVRGEIETRVL